MKLALGTVQFGLDYGVSNSSGQVDISNVKQILNYASEAGIDLLDSASAYGNSEQILGQIDTSQNFDLVTKIPKLTPDCSSILPFISNSVKNLKRNQLSAVLFHHADDLITHPKRDHFYHELSELKQQGTVQQIGASLYEPEQWLAIKRDYSLDVLQVPVNCLDQRFISAELIADFKQHNIKLHCRSLFLQGLLLMPAQQRPAYFKSFETELSRFDSLVKKLKCSPLAFALASIRLLTQKATQEMNNKVVNKASIIDYLVVGCCSKEQLIEIITAYQHSQNLTIETAELKATASDELRLINPSLWQLN